LQKKHPCEKSGVYFLAELLNIAEGKVVLLRSNFSNFFVDQLLLIVIDRVMQVVVILVVVCANICQLMLTNWNDEVRVSQCLRVLQNRSVESRSRHRKSPRENGDFFILAVLIFGIAKFGQAN